MKKIIILACLAISSTIVLGQNDHEIEEFDEYGVDEIQIEYVLTNHNLMVSMGPEVEFKASECVGCYPEYDFSGGINYFYKLKGDFAVGGSVYWNTRRFNEERFFLNLSENSFEEITPLLKNNFDSYAIAPALYYIKSGKKFSGIASLKGGLHLCYKNFFGFSYYPNDTTLNYEEKFMSASGKKPGIGFFGKGSIGVMYGDAFSPKFGLNLSLTHVTGSIKSIYSEETNNSFEGPIEVAYTDKFKRSFGSVELFVIFPMVISREKEAPSN